MRSELVLTREQCRAIDAYAIQVLGIPGIVLMENAGRTAAEHVHARGGRGEQHARAAIIAGRGNNGGDGFVIARHLLRLGWEALVYLAADPASLSADAAVNYAPLERLQIPSVRIDSGDPAEHAAAWERCDVVIDALLGTGFEGQVREPYAGIITLMNALRSPRISAVDVPSGLDAASGQAGGLAVEADETITFLASKPGFLKPGAKRYTGEIVVADTGIPLETVLTLMAAQP